HISHVVGRNVRGEVDSYGLETPGGIVHIIIIIVGRGGRLPSPRLLEILEMGNDLLDALGMAVRIIPDILDVAPVLRRYLVELVGARDVGERQRIAVTVGLAGDPPGGRAAIFERIGLGDLAVAVLPGPDATAVGQSVIGPAAVG